jgi:hypothetical protein
MIPPLARPPIRYRSQQFQQVTAGDLIAGGRCGQIADGPARGGLRPSQRDRSREGIGNDRLNHSEAPVARSL